MPGNWVWVKIKPPGDRRFQVWVTNLPGHHFGVIVFDPLPGLFSPVQTHQSVLTPNGPNVSFVEVVSSWAGTDFPYGQQRCLAFGGLLVLRGLRSARRGFH